VVRTAEALDGLALVGTASAGPLAVAPPFLLVPEGHALPEGVPSLPIATEPSPPSGHRRYRIGGPETGWRFELEIPTPEVGPPAASVRTDGAVAFVRGPLTPEDVLALNRAAPDLVVLSNARALLLEGEPFLSALRSIRGAVGPRPLLWAPRTATPNRVPFLVYVGVDVLDATETLLDAVEGRKADAELGVVESTRTGYCDCPACRASAGADRAGHNLHLLGRELARARAATSDQRLRELVESRLPSEPLLGELLRYADVELADLLEERSPVIGTEVRPYVLRESFRRPEVRRFRQRFEDRYRPPPSKSLLLLVPCSKTKPYRNSRSHRRFASAWEDLPRPERIHKVSVTSPLGVVPKELEDVPPARHYDISVTGDWDAAERAAVVRGVELLREKGRYHQIVVHLDPEEFDFLRPILPEGPNLRWTAEVGRSTSPESLARLRVALQESLAAAPRPAEGPMSFVREELRAIGEFQFGSAASHALLVDPVRLHGRPWFQRLSDGSGTDLATWREERGLFQLTVAGGVRMGAVHGNAVEVADGVDLKGDLFSPGVVRADPGIREGDAVVLHRHGQVLGVGEAVLPGPLMAALGRGCAIKVRHRAGAGAPGVNPIPDGEIAQHGPVV
jgi:archaeosine synthase